MFTIESVAHNLVTICFSDSKVSGTIACKTVCGPFVQLISREISQVTSSLTFSTRNSILETLDSILETRYSKLLRIDSRGSRIESRGTVNLLLSGTVFYLGIRLHYTQIADVFLSLPCHVVSQEFTHKYATLLSLRRVQIMPKTTTKYHVGFFTPEDGLNRSVCC